MLPNSSFDINKIDFKFLADLVENHTTLEAYELIDANKALKNHLMRKSFWMDRYDVGSYKDFSATYNKIKKHLIDLKPILLNNNPKKFSLHLLSYMLGENDKFRRLKFLDIAKSTLNDNELKLLANNTNSLLDILTSNYGISAFYLKLISIELLVSYPKPQLLPVLLSLPGLTVLSKALISFDQALDFDVPSNLMCYINLLNTSNVQIALHDGLISKEWLAKHYKQASLSGLFSHKGLSFLRKKQSQTDAKVEDIESTILMHEIIINSDEGQLAINDRLITTEQIVSTDDFALLDTLISKNGIKAMKSGFLSADYALQKFTLNPLNLLHTSKIECLLSDNGIHAFENKLLSPETAKIIDLDHLELLLSDNGFDALNDKSISADEAITIDLAHLEEVLREPCYSALRYAGSLNKLWESHFGLKNYLSFKKAYNHLSTYRPDIKKLFILGKLKGYDIDRVISILDMTPEERRQFILKNANETLNHDELNQLLQRDTFLNALSSDIAIFAINEGFITLTDIISLKNPQTLNAIVNLNGIILSIDGLISFKNNPNITDDHIDFWKNLLSDNGTKALQHNYFTFDEVQSFPFTTLMALIKICTDQYDLIRDGLITISQIYQLRDSKPHQLSSQTGSEILRQHLLTVDQLCQLDSFKLQFLNSPVGIIALREKLFTFDELLACKDLHLVELLITDLILDILRDFRTLETNNDKLAPAIWLNVGMDTINLYLPFITTEIDPSIRLYILTKMLTDKSPSYHSPLLVSKLFIALKGKSIGEKITPAEIDKVTSELSISGKIYAQGPLNKSDATRTFEYLLREIAHTDESNIQISFDTSLGYILKINDKTDVYLNELLKQVNFDHIELPITDIIQLANIAEKLDPKFIENGRSHYYNDDVLAELPIQLHAAIGHYTSTHYKNINRIFRGLPLDSNHEHYHWLTPTDGRNNLLINFLTGCLVNWVASAAPETLRQNKYRELIESSLLKNDDSPESTLNEWRLSSQSYLEAINIARDSGTIDSETHATLLLCSNHIRNLFPEYATIDRGEDLAQSERNGELASESRRLANPQFMPSVTSFSVFESGSSYFSKPGTTRTKIETSNSFRPIINLSEGEILIPLGTCYYYEKGLYLGEPCFIGREVRSPDLIPKGGYASSVALAVAYQRHLNCAYLDHDHTIELNKTLIARPNHGLAHTYRVMSYIDLVISYFALHAKDIADDGFRSFCENITFEESELLRIAAAFSVTGRESEITAHENPDRYDQFRSASAMHVSDFLKEHPIKWMSKEREDRLIHIVRWMGNPRYENPKDGKPAINQHENLLEMKSRNYYHRILTIAHKLDLPRCYNANHFHEAMTLCRELSSPIPTQTMHYNQLLRYAISLIRAHGNRLSTDISPSDELIDVNIAYASPFEKVSTNLRQCREMADTVPALRFESTAQEEEKQDDAPAEIPRPKK